MFFFFFVYLSVRNVVDQSCRSAGVDDQLRQLNTHAAGTIYIRTHHTGRQEHGREGGKHSNKTVLEV